MFGTNSAPADEGALRAQFLERFADLKGRRLLLFMGRIHPKKGCDLLIRAFARVAALDPRLHLVMAGPDQTGWQATLQQLAAELGIAARICWPGMLRDQLKWGALYSAEAFVLPSHQENFGLAVAEALSCGVPVLISDKVNIWQEIQADGAGFVAQDTVAGTESLLRGWLSLAAAKQAALREQARRTFRARFAMEATASDLIEVIRGSSNSSVGTRPVRAER